MPFCNSRDSSAKRPRYTQSIMDAAPSQSHRTDFETQDWHLARRRIMLYLELLEVDPIAMLEVAHLALKRAICDYKEKGPDYPQPTAAAMAALRAVLSDRKTANGDLQARPGGPKFTGSLKYVPHPPHHTPPEASRTVGRPSMLALPIMPPLDRGHMVPEKVNRLTLKSLLAILWTFAGRKPPPLDSSEQVNE